MTGGDDREPGASEVTVSAAAGLRIDIRLVTYDGLPDGDEETAWLADELRAAGLTADVRSWRDPAVVWGEAGVTVVRSTWDYWDHWDAFLAWADQVAKVSRLLNPPSILKWNSHKRYLLDLEARGIPIVPTVLATDPTQADVGNALRQFGGDRVVLKPAVSGDGYGVRLVGGGEGLGAPDGGGKPEGDWLIQPYLPSLAEQGEVSLMFFGGVFSHAIRREPGAGDYRVQERLGGRVVQCDPQDEFRVLARACVDAVPEASYARVDLVSHDGAPVLMELELVGPSFFVREAGATSSGFVDMVRGALSRD